MIVTGECTKFSQNMILASVLLRQKGFNEMGF